MCSQYSSIISTHTSHIYTNQKGLRVKGNLIINSGWFIHFVFELNGPWSFFRSTYNKQSSEDLFQMTVSSGLGLGAAGCGGSLIILNENRKDTHGPINSKLQMCEERPENIDIKMLIYTFLTLFLTFHASMCLSWDQILSWRSVDFWAFAITNEILATSSLHCLKPPPDFTIFLCMLYIIVVSLQHFYLFFF